MKNLEWVLLGLIGLGGFIMMTKKDNEDNKEEEKPSGIKSKGDNKYSGLPVRTWDMPLKPPVSERELEKAFKNIESNYGYEIAKLAEKMYRLETAHFKSGQFQRTYSAGMTKQGKSFPYGWKMFEKLWLDNPILAPDALVEHSNGYTYLGFKTFDSALILLAEYIKRFGAGRWYSTNPDKQAMYLGKLQKITTKFIP